MMKIRVIQVFQPAAVSARPYHWAKNLLVFAPIILGHRWADPGVWRTALVCFLSLSFFASFVYVLNDLLDREADVCHPRKRLRPIASGRLTRQQAAVAAVILLAAGTGAAFALPVASRLVIIGYVLGAIVYSLWAKSIALIDVLLLAGFYTIRVIAGGIATGIVITPWTLAFCMFIFVSLALAKRYVEVDRHGPSERRGYRPEDGRVLFGLGIGTGLLSIQVLALYIHSPEVIGLYTRPGLLWLMCPIVFYWLARIWMLAGRGELADDPVLFALQDAGSYLAAACAVIVLIGATR
jgi:4-hydroxybenzoate polyprenyltransferase